MATFYYRNAPASDGNWNSLGNWWMSYNAVTDTLSVPATSLPVANDDVVMLGVQVAGANAACFVNSGPTPTVRNVTVKTGTLSIPLTATGTIRLEGNSYLLGDPNDSNNWPSGTITGNIEMYDATYIGSGNTSQIAIVGNFSLYDYAGFTGIDITGNATFYDESYLAEGCNFSGDVIPVTFNDNSYNMGIVYSWDRAVIFNHNAANGGAVDGSATFNHNSRNFMITYIDPYSPTTSYGVVYDTVTLLPSHVAALQNSISSVSNGPISYRGENGINGSSILGLA